MSDRHRKAGQEWVLFGCGKSAFWCLVMGLWLAIPLAASGSDGRSLDGNRDSTLGSQSGELSEEMKASIRERMAEELKDLDALIGKLIVKEEAQSSVFNDGPLASAESWYRLALATGVDSGALREADAAYGRVLASADSTDLEKAAAEAGAAQTLGRLENSDEMVRNVWPGVWNLLGDQGAYEWYDSAVELALDRSWGSIVERLDSKEDPRVTAVFPRCEGDDESCGILRDMVLLSATAAPHLRGVTDHELAAIQSPASLGKVGHPPALQDGFAEQFPDEFLLIPDIHVHPPIRIPDDVQRVSVRVQKVNLLTGASHAVAFATDVGVDVIPRWWHSWAFLLGGFFLIVGCAVRVRVLPSTGANALAGGVLFAAGGLMTVMLQEGLSPLEPAMDDLAWDPNGFPLLTTWSWPILLGLGMVLGPFIVGLIGRSVVMPRVRSWTGSATIRWDWLMVLVAVSGAVCLMFSFPTLQGSPGWWMAGALSVGIGASVAGASRTLGGLHNSGPYAASRGVLSVAAGTAVVVAMLLTDSAFWTAIPAVFAVPAMWVAPTEKAAPAQVRRDELAVDIPSELGSLAIPGLVEDALSGSVEAASRLANQTEHGALVLMGPSGSGKTRGLHALADSWGSFITDEFAVVEARPSGASATDSAAYDVLAQLLRGTMPVLNRLEAIERAAETDASFADAGGALLDSLPGVGLVLGLLPPSEAESGSERLKADALDAVLRMLDDRDVIWVIDDMDDVDAESWEAIAHILAGLSSASVDRGSLKLVLSCDDSAVERVHELSGLLSVDSVSIDPLTADTVAKIVASSGIETPNRGQVGWLLGFGDTPGAILSVVRHLDASDQLRKTEGEPPRLPPVGVLERLAEPIPSNLLERELRRLLQIPEEHLLILEMAAQCGLQFEAYDLAAGLGATRMHVLNALRKIEIDEGLIEDRNEDDRFSFLMRVTHQALIHRTQTRRPQSGGGHGIPEIARAFHAQVADSLAVRWNDNSAVISAERIYRHLQFAGPARAGELPHWAIVSAEEAATVCAWGRASEWVQKVKRSRGQLSYEESDRFSFVEACSLMASGTEADRALAVSAFRQLIDSTHVDGRSALLRWLEVSYEEPEATKREHLQKELKSLESREWTTQGMAETVDFYRVLVAYAQGDEGYGSSATVEHLRRVGRSIGALLAENSDGYDRFLGLMHARVLNEIGLKLFQWNGTAPPEDLDAQFNEATEHSLRLKETYGDLAGQAATMGLMGDFMHFKQQDFDRARGFYEKDRVLLEKMNDRNKQPGILNKLSLVIAKAGTNSTAIDESVRLATRSMRLATELGREADMFWATLNLLGLQSEHNLPTDIWGQAVVDVERLDVLAEIRSPNLKKHFADVLAKALANGDSEEHPAGVRLLTQLKAELPANEA